MPSTNDHGQRVGDVVPGWTPRQRPTATVLTGRYVTLEPLSTDHAEALYRALCNPGDEELWTYRPPDAPADVPAMAALIEQTVAAADVLYARTLQLMRPATEAIHLSMRHAFDDLGYRRFEWKCDSLNEPSRRAAARLGFIYEGRFRHHMITKGRNRDTDWFSVTDTEWPAVKAAHERWLDPANFDDAGLQLAALSQLW